MKLLRALFSLGIWPIVHLTCAQVNDGGGAGASAIGAGKSSFTEEDIPDVGVVAVHAIASGDEQVAEELIERLETDGETTGETRCPLRARSLPRRTYGGPNWYRMESS